MIGLSIKNNKHEMSAKKFFEEYLNDKKQNFTGDYILSTYNGINGILHGSFTDDYSATYIGNNANGISYGASTISDITLNPENFIYDGNQYLSNQLFTFFDEKQKIKSIIKNKRKEKSNKEGELYLFDSNYKNEFDKTFQIHKNNILLKIFGDVDDEGNFVRDGKKIDSSNFIKEVFSEAKEYVKLKLEEKRNEKIAKIEELECEISSLLREYKKLILINFIKEDFEIDKNNNINIKGRKIKSMSEIGRTILSCINEVDETEENINSIDDFFDQD